MQPFVHITGSVPVSDGTEAVELVRHTVYELAREFLRQDIGMVVLVGASKNNAVAAFDTIIVQAVADYVREAGDNGVVLKTVRHRDKWHANTDSETRQHLAQIGEGVCDESLSDEEYTGGNIRSLQVDKSDGVVVVGGARGVNDTGTLMLDDSLPVEEIIVKGVSGGLSDKSRSRLEESRGYDSRLDQRTVSNWDDCKKVVAWVVANFKERLNAPRVDGNQNGESSQTTSDIPRKGWSDSLWDRVTSSRVASWVSAIASTLRLIIAWITGGLK